jgi:hypothetical protein
MLFWKILSMLFRLRLAEKSSTEFFHAALADIPIALVEKYSALTSLATLPVKTKPA